VEGDGSRQRAPAVQERAGHDARDATEEPRTWRRRDERRERTGRRAESQWRLEEHDASDVVRMAGGEVAANVPPRE
jgi:hypothetical protein